MERLKHYVVMLDGIDKSGKDTIKNYVWRLDKRLNVFVRGWLSLSVYADKFDRDCEYELPDKNVLYVLCDVNKDDWKIRCEMTNESPIVYEKDKELFDKYYSILQNKGYHVKRVNTTEQTPYNIAKEIIQILEELNNAR